mmetsp:Transcript_66883/g.209264  ORF Transcript_66883/g.209264 Transcript_66883/m.209264 type:complete len:329 (-) Transcript_66883:269-1255(-)
MAVPAPAAAPASICSAPASLLSPCARWEKVGGPASRSAQASPRDLRVWVSWRTCSSATLSLSCRVVAFACQVRALSSEAAAIAAIASRRRSVPAALSSAAVSFSSAALAFASTASRRLSCRSALASAAAAFASITSRRIARSSPSAPCWAVLSDSAAPLHAGGDGWDGWEGWDGWSSDSAAPLRRAGSSSPAARGAGARHRGAAAAGTSSWVCRRSVMNLALPELEERPPCFQLSTPTGGPDSSPAGPDVRAVSNMLLPESPRGLSATASCPLSTSHSRAARCPSPASSRTSGQLSSVLHGAARSPLCDPARMICSAASAGTCPVRSR